MLRPLLPKPEGIPPAPVVFSPRASLVSVGAADRGATGAGQRQSVQSLTTLFQEARSFAARDLHALASVLQPTGANCALLETPHL
jgi:hypothetical protein